MRYQTTHITTYTFSRATALNPHMVRLQPRSDNCQQVRAFSLAVFPEPTGMSPLVDLAGNATTRLWFREPTEELQIKAVSEVETFRTNPFDFILEPWAVTLPLDYPTSLQVQLQPYLQGTLPQGNIDPEAIQLAQEILLATEGQTVAFLTALNQRLYDVCRHQFRETGAPLPAGATWRQQAGSCRDLTVLLMETCRAVNLAARFVSGYQEGDLDQDERHLHAWAEVYLPGAGWRGFDPTQGLAVGDRHIALAASAFPQYAAPVSGSIRGEGVQSQLEYQLTIRCLD